MSRQKAKIHEATDEVRKRFRFFAGMVLAEHCELVVGSEERPIGQEGKKFEFPYFEVSMNVRSFRSNSECQKADPHAVSESQREFLDIAFRLALISTVTDGKADSMLVLETPESSLDSLFVYKAGEAFRQYAEDPKRQNLLIRQHKPQQRRNVGCASLVQISLLRSTSQQLLSHALADDRLLV